MAKIIFGDDHAVSEIIGAILMVGIGVTMGTVIMGLAMTVSTAQLSSARDTANGIHADAVEIVNVCNGTVKYCSDFVSWIKNQRFGNDPNATTDPPFVEFEFDSAKAQWLVSISRGIGFPWYEISFEQDGKIVPPVEIDDEVG